MIMVNYHSSWREFCVAEEQAIIHCVIRYCTPITDGTIVTGLEIVDV